MRTIGYVIPDFPVLSETFVGNEMRAMEALGHRVVPIGLRRPATPGQPDDEAWRERTVYLADITAGAGLGALARPSRHFARGLAFACHQKSIRPRSLVWTAARVAAAARAAGCDHLHAHFSQASAAVAIVAARLLGITVSFVGHGSDVFVAPSDLPAKLNAADFAVAVCCDMANHFHGLAPGAAITTIHCGVDPGRFRPRPTPRSMTSRRRLLFVARLIDCKGLDDLLTALAHLRPDMRPDLDVVGDGLLRQAWERQAGELGLRGSVSFLGTRPAPWLIENGPYYDGFVAPFREGSNGARDTGPVVVKEAMAMGLPVIASHFMGLAEMVTPDTGWLIPPRNVKALGNMIEGACRLPSALIDWMGTQARERVLSHYSLARQAESLSVSIERSGAFS